MSQASTPAPVAVPATTELPEEPIEARSPSSDAAPDERLTSDPAAREPLSPELPDPDKPLPKAPFFVELRGEGRDDVLTKNCSREKVPTAVFATYGDPSLVIIANGDHDCEPFVLLTSRSLNHVGISDRGRTQITLEGDETYMTELLLTVTVNKYGPVGGVVEGSYVTALVAATTDYAIGGSDAPPTHTYYGRFRVRRLADDPTLSTQ